MAEPDPGDPCGEKYAKWKSEKNILDNRYLTAFNILKLRLIFEGEEEVCKRTRLNKIAYTNACSKLVLKNSLINQRPISELVGRGVVQKVAEDPTVRVHRQLLLKPIEIAEIVT